MRLFGFRNGHRTAGSVRNRLYLLLIAVLVPVLGVQAAIYVNYLHTSTQQELTANQTDWSESGSAAVRKLPVGLFVTGPLADFLPSS